MASGRKTLLLAVLVAVPLGLLLFALLARGGRERTGDRRVLPDAAPAPEAPALQVVELIPLPELRQAVGGDRTTTVLWPLRVELELIEARFLPRMEGVPAVGSGARARLSGQIAGVNDQGVQAEILFTAGANQGRVLRTAPDGRFGATDLYPGLSVVEVRGSGILGSRRVVRLRRDAEALLNIGYGRPGMVFGKVQDRKGNGLEGAEVTVDGTRTTTGPEGEFYLASVAAGQVLVEVEKQGYAPYGELVAVTGGVQNPKERMTFTLGPAAELSIAVANNVGGPGPVQVYLYSDQKALSQASAFRSELLPWHERNPIEVWPGKPVLVDSLPAQVIKLHAFRPGARAPLQVVNLASGRPQNVTIHLEPAPLISGRVLFDGQPVAGARVRLEAPDRVRATLNHFREASYFLESAVLPDLPPALQELESAKDGRFVFSAWSEDAPVRYLEARGPDGKTWAGRFVRGEEQDIELVLQEVDLGDSTLELTFPGRHQGLPVEVWIGGAPHAAQVLAAEEDFVLERLLAGRWLLRISWHGTPLHEAELVIEEVTRQEIALPPECIDGQDEEQWKRAGKEYPRS
jgi:hypothetical protein